MRMRTKPNYCSARSRALDLNDMAALLPLQQQQQSLSGIPGPWKKTRRSSKTCLLEGLGPPLREPDNELDATKRSSPSDASTFPVSKPAAPQAKKTGLSGALRCLQVSSTNLAAAESHTGTGTGHVKKQPHKQRDDHTSSSDCIKRNSSVPDIHSENRAPLAPPPSHLPPHPPTSRPVTLTTSSHTHQPHTTHQAHTTPQPHVHVVTHPQPSPHPAPVPIRPLSPPHPSPTPHSQPPSSHDPPSSHKPPPNPPSHSFFLPPKEEDIIVMASGSDERKFRRLELLGRGGSSKVYKVISENCEIYAVKEVYLKHVDNAVKNAYVTEINFLKRLKNVPEVVTLHSCSWDKKEGILYLLLEYAEADLATIIKNREPSLHTALYYWNEMLRILEIIHEEGIIHNDLKPENFVCVQGRLKLIDFGIANRIEDEHTSVNRDLCCGTINYMSPESIDTYEDKGFFKVGRPSDVWSLGCILYQMLYGHTPFHSYKKLQKLQAITNPAVSIPFCDLGNPAAIDIMKKCLTRNPKERPTVKELLCHPFTLCQGSV